MFKLAVPTFDDFNSLSCCLVANLNQPHVSGAVVVDNNPTSPQGKLTASFCTSLGVRYVPLSDNVGTASAKNRAIRECGDVHVICMDSHVLLMPGATTALANWYLDGGEGVLGDLHHGPMMHDNLQGFDTHFATTWTEDRVAAEVARLKGAGRDPSTWADVQVGRQLWSEGMWGQWESSPLAHTQTAFQIAAMGMGCFAVHGGTWQGFHPDMRGFGGEEVYIQEKYRKAGKRVWCVSGFRWWHRFAKGEGTPHVVRGHDKYRNYWIGFKELGLDPTEMQRHFRGWMSEADCVAIEEGKYDPTQIAFGTNTASGSSCNTCGTHALAGKASLREAVDAASLTPSDINEHVQTLYSLAVRSNGCMDVGSRVESSLALAGSKGGYHHLGSLSISERQMVYQYRGENVTVPSPDAMPEYEFAFIDTDPHDAEPVYQQLIMYGTSSKHWIAVHDSHTYGERGSSGGPGVMPAVRRFIRENPQWTVVRHDKNNHGLVVLSCRPEDKKPLPPLWKQAWNVTKASIRAHANVLADYGPLTDTLVQEKRLALCMVCPSHTDGKCAECGCPTDKKTSWPTELCPLGNWTVEAKELPLSAP